MEKTYKGKIMTEDELKEFVESVGRSELYQEYIISEEVRVRNVRLITFSGPCFYYKGISSALSSLGYDTEWVVGVAMPAIRDRYAAEAESEAADEVSSIYPDAYK